MDRQTRHDFNEEKEAATAEGRPVDPLFDSWVALDRAVEESRAAQRALYAPEVLAMLEALRVGSIAASEWAIVFLEADPRCSGRAGERTDSSLSGTHSQRSTCRYEESLVRRDPCGSGRHVASGAVGSEPVANQFHSAASRVQMVLPIGAQAERAGAGATA